MKEGIFQEVAYTLTQFMTDVGSMFTTAMSWVGDVAATIVEQPLLLASAAVGFIGLGIGIYKRLTRV